MKRNKKEEKSWPTGLNMNEETETARDCTLHSSPNKWYRYIVKKHFVKEQYDKTISLWQ